MGHPDFQSRGPQIPIFKGFRDLWTENRGAPKTPNSTTTDLTPHLRPSDEGHLRLSKLRLEVWDYMISHESEVEPIHAACMADTFRYIDTSRTWPTDFKYMLRIPRPMVMALLQTVDAELHTLVVEYSDVVKHKTFAHQVLYHIFAFAPSLELPSKNKDELAQCFPDAISP